MRKRLTILGSGISARGAAKLALLKGYDLFVSDRGILPEGFKSWLIENNIDHEEGGHNLDLIINSDEVIKSPGIPPSASIIQALNSRNIPVIDELELAGRYNTVPAVYITGTNGKTTTTLLTSHLLNTAGFKSKAVGNVGYSYAEAVATGGFDRLVVEASSFQLDGMKTKAAKVGVLLNITVDHLDRYGTFNDYVQSKHQMEELISEGGTFIFNASDSHTLPKNKTLDTKSFSKDADASTNASLTKTELIFTDGDVKVSIPRSEISLTGTHNMMNAMAASWSSRLLGASWESIRSGLSSFQSKEHRMEQVGIFQDVEYINDSKATNLDAVMYALEAFSKPIIWIVGGVDKGNDYREIDALVKSNVRALVALGKDNEKLKNHFTSKVEDFRETSSMEEAVETASSLAKAGDLVLLSPACASFDLFKNYEDRGEQFKAAVLLKYQGLNSK